MPLSFYVFQERFWVKSGLAIWLPSLTIDISQGDLTEVPAKAEDASFPSRKASIIMHVYFSGENFKFATVIKFYQ